MGVFTGHFLAESQAPTQPSLGIEALTPSLEGRRPSCAVPIRWLLQSQKRVAFSSPAPVTLVIRKGILPPPQVQPPIEMGPWELGHLGKRSGGRGEAAGGSAKGTKHKSRGRVLATARGWAQSQFNCTSAGVAKLDSHKKYLSARLFGGGWSAEEDELLQKRQLFKMLFLAKFQPGGSFMSEPLSRS